MSDLRQAEVVDSEGNALMLKSIKAMGAIKGRLLAMSLQQRFCNPGDRNTEVTYRFPLPWGAVLMGIDVVLNGQQLTGEVTAKSTARARYEEALSEGNTSILLERNADLSYTLELGNLMAREECSITVRYAQVLQLEKGQLRLMLPTTIAPRYGNPLTQGRLQPHQTTATDAHVAYPFDITIHLSGDLAKAQVACVSHKTGYQPVEGGLLVKLAQQGALDRDFILVLSELAQQSVAIASPDLWFAGGTAVMASFSPNVPNLLGASVAVKVLVDCSGSMAGDSMGAARNALRSIVLGLEKEDRFTLSKFGSTVEHRSRGMWRATSPAKASALRWVESLEANLGGTEMANALVSTIALAHQGQSDILLVTDGEIEGIEEVIDSARTSGHRVFVVAIGASPAEAHLRRLALATGGVCNFVAPGEDVEPAMLRMFSRLRAQRVDHLRVEWPQQWAFQWAQPAPEFGFHEDAITVYALTQDAGGPRLEGQIRLWGRLAGATDEQVLAQVDVSPVASTTNTLARMTGYAHYTQLMAVADTPAVFRSAAKDIAVAYQLVTDETNFILVHERAEGDKAVEMPVAHKVPQMLAAGWGATGAVHASVRTKLQVVRTGTGLTPLHGQPDYVCMSTPSVWRTRDRSAALDASNSSGMDDFNIPSFLRKQAEDGWFESSGTELDKGNANFWATSSPAGMSTAKAAEWARDNPAHLQAVIYTGLTPAGMVEWLRLHATSRWPQHYKDLQQAGLGIPVCDWLEFVIGARRDELEVVQAFLQVMLEFDFSVAQGIKKAVGAIASAFRAAPVDAMGAINTTLALEIRAALQGLQGRQWPDRVLNFAEESEPV